MDAFYGGPIMAVTGLFFHFFIATAWTSLFFTVYPGIPWLSRNKVTGGLLYGVFIWVVMNLIILPLSKVPHFSIRVTCAAIGMVILMLAVGLPISLRAHKYYLGYKI